MSVFQFRKTPLHRRGSPSRILAISPAIRDNTKVQNAVSTTSAESLAFFSSCASGLRTRKSMAFVLNSSWLEICLAGLPQFFNLPAQLLILNFSIPFGIPFYDGGRVIKHLITLATASQNGHSLFLPVLNGTDTGTRKCQPAAFC